MLVLLAAALIPLAVATWACCSRRGITIDHVLLFTFGYLFYWILPVALGRSRFMATNPALSLWYDTFDDAQRSGNIGRFLAIALATYVAYVLGSALGSRLARPVSGVLPTLPFSPKTLLVFLPPAAALTAAYAWFLRDRLFAGYTDIGGSFFALRGTLIATTLVLLALLLLHAAARDGRSGGRQPLGRVFGSVFLVTYVVAALLVLSVGGRLYLAASVLMVMAYVSVYRAPITYAATTALTGIAAVGAGALGLIRLGGAPSLFGIVANIAAEPLFTSFSLLHFVTVGDFPLFAFPRFLLGDLLNLVPRALLPNKVQLLPNPADYGYVIFAPVGALNSFFSLTINFGTVGSCVVLFLLGFWLSRLRRREGTLPRVCYVMLSGCLAFTFFRDPFSTGVIKNMLQFSVLVPCAVALGAHMLTVVLRQSLGRSP